VARQFRAVAKLGITRGSHEYEEMDGLRYRRDRALREDHSQLRTCHAPHLLAIPNTIVVGLMRVRVAPTSPKRAASSPIQLERTCSSPAT
jgi:hypothetical protein